MVPSFPLYKFVIEMKHSVFLILTGLLLICACTKQGDSKKYPRSAKSAVSVGRYVDLMPDAVLVRIGTNAITRMEFDKLVNLRAKVVKMTLPLAQQGNAVNVSAIRMPLLANLRENFRKQTALQRYAYANGLRPSDADLIKFRKGFLAGCKHQNIDFNKFIRKNFTPDEAKTIDERVWIEAVCEKAKSHYLANNQDKVDKVDVDAFIKRVEKYNRMASATNDIVWAKATNLWQKARSGADFGELADNYSEDSGHTEGGYWGTFSYDEMEKDGVLAKVVAALDVGGISPPVEADNGLNVIKLLNVVDSNGEPVLGARTSDVNYEIARIFLLLPEIYEIPPRDEAARQILAAAQNRAIRQFVEKLIENDGAEYPSGTAIFEKAQQALKMPAMVMQEGVTPQTMENIKKKKGQ